MMNFIHAKIRDTEILYRRDLDDFVHIHKLVLKGFVFLMFPLLFLLFFLVTFNQ